MRARAAARSTGACRRGERRGGEISVFADQKQPVRHTLLELGYGAFGVLLATKEGFAFAAGPADRFDTTGRLAVDRAKLFRLPPAG